MSRLLPLLMNMMKAGAPSPGTASPRQDGEGADGGTRAAPRTHTYAETPFGDIGFAGTEVRTFMETLWRIRKRAAPRDGSMLSVLAGGSRRSLSALKR